MSTKKFLSEDELIRIINMSIDIPNLLQNIIENSKSLNSRVSYEWIARSIGMSSKSNISDMVKGRRKFSKKYRQKFLNLFKVTGIPRLYIERWIVLEYDNLPSDRYEKEKYDLDILKKTLDIHFVGSIDEICWRHAIVYSSLGLFQDGASENQISKLPINISDVELSKILEDMVTNDLFKKENGKYYFNDRQVILKNEKNNENKTHIKFIKKGFKESIHSIENHFNSSNAYFESVVLSVESRQYKKKLKELRDMILKFQAEIESDYTEGADSIISFNISSFPILTYEDRNS